MSLFNSVFSIIFRAFFYFGLTIAILLITPGLPPNIRFSAYRLKPAAKLEGKLAPNSILDKAEILPFKGSIKGPESIAIRNDNIHGQYEIYTGIESGALIKIKNGQISTVAKFGSECEGPWEAKKCGRTLGLRFDSFGKLIALDAYYGIFEVDVDSGSYKQLLSLDSPIDGKKPSFPNDLDVSKDGTIYFSDSSTNAKPDHMIIELLGEPSGRLIKFDRNLNKTSVLIDKLHFPNGVQLSQNEDFVLVSELARSRVWRYYLKGPNKGVKEVFMDNIPGMPDNIRPNKRGGFFIPLPVPRLPQSPSVGDILGPLPYLRKIILRVQSLILILISTVNSVLPNIYLSQAQVYIKEMGPLSKEDFLPKEVIVIECDENGSILGSFQNKKGNIWQISEMRLSENYAYFGSPQNNKIWRIKISDLWS